MLKAMQLLLVLIMTLVLGLDRTYASDDQTRCESSLTDFSFDLTLALGTRGFLGSLPEASPRNSAIAARQGVFHWGHSIAVKPTIEAAREHDARFRGLEKILYFISDVDVSDLTDVTAQSSPMDIQRVRFRFSKIFETAEIVYFDDSEAILQNNPNIEPELKKVDPKLARSLMTLNNIYYFTKDDRGPRFNQGGWVFPQIRGVVTYYNVFESGSNTIRKILNQSRSLQNQGYTILFNGNFIESLNMARTQKRLERDEIGNLIGVVANSRYRDPETYNLALDSFKIGDSFSVEVRDPKGRLMAGSIGTRNGNLISMETVFYNFVNRETGEVFASESLDGSQDVNNLKSLIDYAKIAVISAVHHFHKVGIDVIDGGMVTPFTAGIKGVYVSGDKFAGYVNDLNSQPKVDLKLDRIQLP